MNIHRLRHLIPAAALATLLTAPAQAAPENFEVDGTHSFIVFHVTHLGIGTAWGRFNEFSGSFTHDAENPAASKVSFTIQAESVDTGNAKRDQHLRSPDFFDAKQFPEISFRSTKVEPIAEGAMDVTGELTFHGVTKTITARADLVGSGKDPWGNFRRGYDIQFTLNRNDFGVSYMPGGLGDGVKVFVSVEGIRK